jgi:hypothetical protein
VGLFDYSTINTHSGSQPQASGASFEQPGVDGQLLLPPHHLPHCLARLPPQRPLDLLDHPHEESLVPAPLLRPPVLLPVNVLAKNVHPLQEMVHLGHTLRLEKILASVISGQGDAVRHRERQVLQLLQSMLLPLQGRTAPRTQLLQLLLSSCQSALQHCHFLLLFPEVLAEPPDSL